MSEPGGDTWYSVTQEWYDTCRSEGVVTITELPFMESLSINNPRSALEIDSAHGWRGEPRMTSWRKVVNFRATGGVRL